MTRVRVPIHYAAGSDASSLTETLRAAVVEVRSPSGGGAGLIWGDSGLVVTNAHCVRRAASVQLGIGDVWHQVEAITCAPDSDLALIRVPSIRGPSLVLRDPGSLRPGELVFAYGHPLGVSHALAMGALHGVVRHDRTGEARFIVSDVRLAPGNSGGPLVDAEGRLLGLNSMVVGGLGVAIPATVVESFVSRAAKALAA